MQFVQARYGKLAILDQEDLIAASVTAYGEWAQHEIWFIERLVPVGGVVLDVGAYIGTHTLPLSEFVGPNGRVYSFEPQPAAFAALQACLAENKLSNVVLHNFALGERNKRVDPQKALSNRRNAGSFSLLTAAETEAPDAGLPVKTLDSLELQACDFIKIDAEGMEVFVLRGGVETLTRCRPVLFCECNFLETGAPVLEWARTHSYIAYGVVFQAFNEHNFLGNTHNMFGRAGEVSITLVPGEKAAEFSAILKSVNATEIGTLDDLALVLHRKTQYLAEIAEQAAEKSFANTAGGAATENTLRIVTSDREQMRSGRPQLAGQVRALRIVVPFYKNPQLVRPLFNSLQDCAEELRQLDARVFFYNDSPDDEGLRVELDRCVRDHRGLELTIIRNPENLGFVGTVNRAFKSAIEHHEDLVLLNSDTCVFRGAIAEMQRVAYHDPMIAFVSPRSNNATICTFPHGSEALALTAAECFERFRTVSPSLPKISYAPTAVGFCLYVKYSVLAETGGFDTQYGKGYNEENDLIMRANRLGYRAALANHAFVWHQGEQSFGTLEQARAERERVNARLLASRYPEYPVLIDEYFRSPEFQAEELVGTLCPDAQGRLTIGFDLSNFGTYHNGTFEAGKSLLRSAVKCWPETFDIVAFMSRQAWDFHALETFGRIKWVDTHAPAPKVAALVRMGQPFDTDAIRRMIVRAPVVAIFMLDTIAADCGYLRTEFNQLLWHFTLKWFDIVLTNSRFTAEQLLRRYPVGSDTVLCTSMHSVTPDEYRSRTSAVALISEPSTGVLVIGNKFEHKALMPTVRALAEALPDLPVKALGCSSSQHPNVQCVETGTLSDEELDGLYASVSAVVFPSHYEGFGFPILHALARSKPIYVRRLPVFEEIVSCIQVGKENVRWFESTRDLVAQLALGVAEWIGPDAVGEPDGWNRSANEVLQVVQARMQAVRHETLADRLRWFSAAFAGTANDGTSNLGQAELATRFVSRKIERVVGKVLSKPAAYKALRLAWHASKRVPRK